MKSNHHIENPDVILIGSGIMSATLGAVLKGMDPSMRIQLYECTEGLADEASNGWHNAGTGHAGLCELSYTQTMAPTERSTLTRRSTSFTCSSTPCSSGAMPYATA